MYHDCFYDVIFKHCSTPDHWQSLSYLSLYPCSPKHPVHPFISSGVFLDIEDRSLEPIWCRFILICSIYYFGVRVSAQHCQNQFWDLRGYPHNIYIQYAIINLVFSSTWASMGHNLPRKPTVECYLLLSPRTPTRTSRMKGGDNHRAITPTKAYNSVILKQKYWVAGAPK